MANNWNVYKEGNFAEQVVLCIYKYGFREMPFSYDSWMNSFDFGKKLEHVHIFIYQDLQLSHRKVTQCSQTWSPKCGFRFFFVFVFISKSTFVMSATSQSEGQTRTVYSWYVDGTI